MFKVKRCKKCEEKIKDSFDFCPYCGLDLRNPEKELEDYGMLGKNNHLKGYPLVGGLGGLGITDKMINSIFNSLMKNLEKQMQNIDPEVESSSNGIRIKFGNHLPKKAKSVKNKTITQEQIQRMSKLPRIEAKADVRRFSDKIVYELKAPGIYSVDDVFVSKLESGYEVKAIGKKKVYVNSIPVNLPLKGYSINEKGLNVEFGLQ